MAQSYVCEDSRSAPMSIDTPSASPSMQTRVLKSESDYHHSPYLSWEFSASSSSSSPVIGDFPMKRKLTTSSSNDSRPSRPPTLQPSYNQFPRVQTDSAISVPGRNYYHHNRHDVRPPFVNASASYPITQTSSNLRNVPHHSASSDSLPLENTSTSATHDVSINQSSTRPRTSNQVFHNVPDLAAHYGIPQFLPPVPRTTPRRLDSTSFGAPPSGSTINSSGPRSDSPEFQNLCSNYLNMLSTTTNDNRAAEDAAPQVSNDMMGTSIPPEEFQALVDVLQASPEFRMSNDFGFGTDPISEYLTSPLDDSPFDDFLRTPAMDCIDGSDMMTSPIVADYDGNLFGDGGLFGGMSYEYPAPAAKSSFEPPRVPAPASAARPNFDNMYTMSPATPSLDPSSLYPSPHVNNIQSFPTRRKSTATGTRKNLTPAALVPVDAPTQPRKYITPSSTSRKEIPAVFARKRARSQAFGDDEDQLEEDNIMLPPNPTEQELIDAKRRQNTVAARKSRKRKLEYQKELEDQVERLRAERDTWKTQALTCQALLRSHGHECPPTPEM